MPAFVNGYGWVSTTHAVQGYAGAVLVVSLSYYPLVYLPTVAALRRLDPGLEEVAGSLGRSAGTTFVRVVLPAIRPAVLGGSLLVGLHLLAEYGALQLLRFPTLTTGILDQYRSTLQRAGGHPAGRRARASSAWLLLALELLARGRRRYARVGAGAPRPVERRHLGRLLPVSARRPGRSRVPVAGRPAGEPRPLAADGGFGGVPGRRC